MDNDRLTDNKFLSLFDLIYILFMTNVLWVSTMTFGLFIFTVMPATIAVFIIVSGLNSGYQGSYIKLFFNIIKKEYVRSQKVFFVLLILGAILAFNLNFFMNIDKQDWVNQVGLVISYVIGIGFAIILIHVFPIYIHFPKLKTFNVIKFSFLIGVAYPLHTIGCFIIIGLASLLTMVMPPLFFFIIFSVTVYLIMKLLSNKYQTLLKDGNRLTIKDYK